MRHAMPAAWVDNDDPNDPDTLQLCDVKIRIPKMADSCPILKAFGKELDKDEAKFRAGRKDKNIGGELGSLIAKKRQGKSKRGGFSTRRSYASGELFHSIIGASRSSKRHFDGASDGPGSKRFRGDMYYYEEEDEDFHASFKNTVKEIAKLAKARQERCARQQRHLKLWASGCAREVRKRAMKPIRVADEAPKRARKIVKQVLAFWRKEDKERQEERKKVLARAEEQRKVDAEEREAQRQQNKLKYLLGQSEEFSRFLQAKDKATVKATSAKKGAGMDAIQGDENEEQLKSMAALDAQKAIAAHQARIKQFDMETKEKKSAADASAAKRERGNELVRQSLSDMNGVNDEERKLLQNELAKSKEGMEIKKKVHVGERESKNVEEDGKIIKPVRQPSILNCKMKDYQIRGLSWLVSLYDQGINGILADEMGLGKTLQTISLLAYLAEEEANWGPFLVVTPKATLHNWQQEIVKFCPVLKVLPYWGNKSQRQELRKYWAPKRMYRRDSEFHVCVTSYETLTTDNNYFHRVKWQYMILDEAQAIKNSSSSRWKALLAFPCRNRLLLTGTPLQNKLSELWSLLHFIMPAIFDSHADFADWFAKDIEKHATTQNHLDIATLSRLRRLLDPFMLRRVKRDVESEMPPKTEHVLHCDLSGRQRQLYAKVKSNVSITDLVQSIGGNSGADAERNSKLMNIVMQLRKVCNHPETFERREPVAPFQFQRKPPPFHTPHPPSVLSGGTSSQPPLGVTILTRSEIVLQAPRAIVDMAISLRRRKDMLVRQYGFWNKHTIRDRVEEDGVSGLSMLRLCDGLSPSEAVQIGVGDWSVTNWQSMMGKTDDAIRSHFDFYRFEDHEGPCEHGTKRSRQRLITRRLLFPRAKFLSRAHSRILIPRQGTPADIVRRDTRLLKTCRVYIPPCSAPNPELYLPGDISRDPYLFGPAPEFLYPEMPVVGSLYSTVDVYNAWRDGFGNYGAHVGTSSILMPDAGRLIADSGKMVTLDPLLKKLKAEGHKVLIYSQFTKVLDILEDYCGKTLLKYVRLDGQSALADRRDIVAEWQTNKELFVFLLSTRAGGVGLNLTAADTVIFFDSDWNPTQDLQAMDRAHRLGQERPVTVYRLISPGTIEARMLERAEQKSRINDLVIKGGGIRSEEDQSKDNEVTDIAGLLMFEEELTSLVEPEAALTTARNAVRILKERKDKSTSGKLKLANGV